MRSLFLSLCFLFTILLAYSHVSYSAEFSYDLDRVTQVGGVLGTDTFVDEFDDGEEPPSGPSGPSTYAGPPFSADAESGGMLNLNSNDAIIGDDPSMDIFASLTDNTFFFNSGSGGRLEGKFRFINGFGTNTGFIITIHDTPLSSLESSSLWIEKDVSGRIVAFFDFWIPDVCTIISEVDITSLLGTDTDITLRLDISTANEVKAYYDIGSTGSFTQMPGSHTLEFPGGTKHTGAFLAFEDSCLDCDLIVNPDGSMDIFLANDCNKVSIPIELKLWAELSDQIFSLLNVGSDGSIVLPPGFQMTVNVSPPGSVPSGLNLVLGLRFVDPVTGEQLCVDTELVP